MGHVKAVILACVDDRLQNDLVRFADERSWSEQFVLMTVPGDCLDIVRCNHRGRGDLERLAWLLENKQPEHLVIIAHQDCAARKDAGVITLDTPVSAQMEMCAGELRIAMSCVLHEPANFSPPEIELFFARQKRDNPNDFDFIPVKLR